jgi:hypothetical protein
VNRVGRDSEDARDPRNVRLERIERDQFQDLMLDFDFAPGVIGREALLLRDESINRFLFHPESSPEASNRFFRKRTLTAQQLRQRRMIDAETPGESAQRISSIGGAMLRQYALQMEPKIAIHAVRIRMAEFGDKATGTKTGA